eukprot:CAMPEP_0176461924 /NCGR_PEP_ID=MMETSP0127-20121128/34948_1 /TAXON_ID=938130 /ORGANISM="Platyophrya macrostoma, Strain WH" /LENGTH=70 /DNA_ID=CAMNT_0017853717 /DNA_START=13 /DNA_END=221 /DNA_ORIENTATION=-
MEYKSVTKRDPTSYNIDALAQFYLDKMNKKAVELFKNKKVEESSRIIARVIDLITQKNINMVISVPEKLA